MSSDSNSIDFYPEQQLEKAISIMVVMDKPLRERLADAMTYHLGFNAADLPTDDMRDAMKGIQEKLSNVPSPGGNAIVATTRQLSDGDARDVAGRIFSLYIDVMCANR
jgi:hypothetical protein